MSIQPRYSKEEHAKRGDDIFLHKIQSQLKDEKEWEYVVIDIETGEYEIDANEIAAMDRLRARCPNAQIWLRRVGSPYARHWNGLALRIRISSSG